MTVWHSAFYERIGAASCCSRLQGSSAFTCSKPGRLRPDCTAPNCASVHISLCFTIADRWLRSYQDHLPTYEGRWRMSAQKIR